ncbi:MAG: type II secretion system protein [Acidobacteria bacterium]|nr:type II secretion system protein [Acidobacteriota bacterium]
MQRTKQRGFTMLELLVVVFIVLIMSAMAVPALFRSIRGYQLEGAARKVANVIVRARFEAVQRNRRICSAFFRAPVWAGKLVTGWTWSALTPSPATTPPSPPCPTRVSRGSLSLSRLITCSGSTPTTRHCLLSRVCRRASTTSRPAAWWCQPTIESPFPRAARWWCRLEGATGF